MIKINLATRKQSPVAAARPAAGKLSGNLDGLKELPLRKMILLGAVVFLGNMTVEELKDSEVEAVQAVLVQAQSEQAKLRMEAAKVAEYEKMQAQIEADERALRTKIQTIQKLTSERRKTIQMLMAVSNAAPDDLWIREISLKDINLSIKGSAVGMNLVSDFMKKLGENRYFTDLNLRSTEQAAPGPQSETADFELAGKTETPESG